VRPHRVCGRPALQQLSLLQQAAREQLHLCDGPVRQAQQNLRRRAGATQDPNATATGRPYIGPHARAHMSSFSHADHATPHRGRRGRPRPTCSDRGAGARR